MLREALGEAIDVDSLIARRSRAVDASGIRRVFELGAKLKDPINLSIGQPDFPVPDAVKKAAVRAIEADHNGYALTTGVGALRDRVAQHLHETHGWPADAGGKDSEAGLIITTGTSGALHLAMLATLDPGDEIIIPDPYFVAYPHMATICGAQAVRCPIYPDFRMTAQRIEPLITERTKAVLIDSPGNPSGVVMSGRECREVAALCRERGVLLISDEIYDEFCFSDARERAHGPGGGAPRCPTPADLPRAWDSTLLVRGFGKTFGCTGWRMGYAAGPRRLIEEMTKMQQYSFVCAPTPLQWGCLATFDVDISGHVAEYERRRDLVMGRLGKVTEVVRPGGAFYAFAKVPERLGLSGQQFCEKALEKSVLVIPGNVFSGRDTHVRISFATAPERLERGLDVLVKLMG
ncbi:MAG: aminotransferase class I/II-fold pyridoxal phosphate-dependent enzyme [Phycisphaerales bacterium]|nr:aminotransferase class I/II-fold pyridoxal phosphate-dependent enzyme [Phycisphaerales bacterium]